MPRKAAAKTAPAKTAKPAEETEMTWIEYVDTTEEQRAALPQGQKVKLGLETSKWCNKLMDKFIIAPPKGEAGNYLARHLTPKQLGRLEKALALAKKAQAEAADRASVKAKKKQAEKLAADIKKLNLPADVLADFAKTLTE